MSLTPEEASAKLRSTVKGLNDRFNGRERVLKAMDTCRLKNLAFDCGLPTDLNRTEMIKHILKNEFKPR